ncbi:MAG: neutral/alkaline non-lysosomal ceramidase N-terminal domain-containing protein [Planctomycetaceae bacterium]|nr:neutral/alkaline non-lysosomal ceramidase N-terminal domain-containing protein [Planctomycetales bacterium]MCB9921322.1 neutral/alkaline non-lysosomal ceramidase N-terminal domain-containing protein [Planctomycetaceae bacterium]
MRRNVALAIVCYSVLTALWPFIAAAAPREFRAGAAKIDITPKLGVSLDGPISKNGPVLGVHDSIHARAIVLSDGETRLAIVICDVCMIGRDVLDAAKVIASQSTGIAANHMLMAATHTHAAPRANHVGTEPLDDEYHIWLGEQIAAAVAQAEQQLAPAQIGWNSFQKPDLIRCRRHLCRPGSVGVNPFGEAGEQVKSVAGTSSAIIEPAGPVDPQFSILSIQHADGSPLAVLGNFSVHYCGGYQRGLVSADYFGHYATALESQLTAGSGHPAFVGLMSNGTSGNTGAIESGGKKYPPFEWMQVAARMLAQETLQAMQSIEYRRDLALAMKETELELEIRRPSPDRLQWATNVLMNPGAKQPHRWSPVYAQEAIHLSKYPATTKVKLQAIRIGDLGIVATPCEVFAETGLAIKRESPHPATFHIELANGYGGYLPPAEQHKLGGYETWPARSSFLEVEAETKIRSTLVQLLHDVREPGE